MDTTRHYAFDTLGYAKALRERGYEQGQAEALAETTRDYIMNEVATKDFVHNEVETAKNEVKNEIKELRSELQGAIKELRGELQGEIKELRSEVQGEIKGVKSELQNEIEKVHLAIKLSNQSLKIWVGSIAVLMTGTLATLMKFLG